MVKAEDPLQPITLAESTFVLGIDQNINSFRDGQRLKWICEGAALSGHSNYVCMLLYSSISLKDYIVPVEWRKWISEMDYYYVSSKL